MFPPKAISHNTNNNNPNSSTKESIYSSSFTASKETATICELLKTMYRLCILIHCFCARVRMRTRQMVIFWIWEKDSRIKSRILFRSIVSIIRLAGWASLGIAWEDSKLEQLYRIWRNMRIKCVLLLVSHRLILGFCITRVLWSMQVIKIIKKGIWILNKMKNSLCLKQLSM